MKSIKLNKTFIPWCIVVILLIYIFSIGKQEKEIVIPSVQNTKVIEKPIPVLRVDTVYKDSIRRVEVEKIVPVKNPVNKDLLAKYEAAVLENDSLKQIQLFKDAVTERKYKEVFEDSIQVITVNSEIIGTLERQTISYRTKPKIISLKPVRMKPSLFIGGFSYASFNEFATGAKLDFMNKNKNKIFTVGYDTEKRVHFGVSIRLF